MKKKYGKDIEKCKCHCHDKYCGTLSDIPNIHTICDHCEPINNMKKESEEDFYGEPIDLKEEIAYSKKRNSAFNKYLNLKAKTMKPLQKLKSLLPKRSKECGCEKDHMFGYHTKNCDLYAYGWNDFREEVLKIIKRIEVK